MFFKIIFFEKVFQEYLQCVKQFGSRSGPHVGPDLDPNCLQSLLADDTNHVSLCFMVLLYADVFQNLIFLKTSFRTNSLDPDRARHNVGPDLGPNCLQSLSADDTNHVLSVSWFLLYADVFQNLIS